MFALTSQASQRSCTKEAPLFRLFSSQKPKEAAEAKKKWDLNFDCVGDRENELRDYVRKKTTFCLSNMPVDEYLILRVLLTTLSA